MKKGLLAIVVLGIFLCVGAILAYVTVDYIPKEVAKSFGAPSPYLTFSQKIRYSLELFQNRSQLLSPKAGAADQEVNFEVKNGDSVSEISGRLQDLGLIQNSGLFTHLLIYAGLDTVMQSGRFNLNQNMSPIEIAVTLSIPENAEIPFVVLAGWRVEEIADSLPTSGIQVAPKDFLSVAKDPASAGLSLPVKDAKGLEGLISPGVSYVKRNTDAKGFIDTLISSNPLAITPDMEAAFAREGLTTYQAIILASIVQREAMQQDEMKLIASVFLNRLQQGMKLESDPTVQYALGFDDKQGTWWRNPLSADDLKVDSPYNTYLHAELPPTPISSPGGDALQAVAFPASTDYLFFQAKCDGSRYHNFARTYEEHLQNSCH